MHYHHATQVGDLMIVAKPQVSTWGNRQEISSLGEAIYGNSIRNKYELI